MPNPQISEFVDATTGLDQTHLNTAAYAKPSLLSGAIPGSSGSLIITLPALSLIVNSGGASVAVTVSPAPITISGGANSTNYVFINASGTLTQSLTNTPGAGYITLLSCLVNGGNTALTSITQLLSPFGLDVDSIGADIGEAATADVLAITTSTGKNNLNRIRKAITNITGGTFAAAVAGVTSLMKADGTNATSPAFPGTISTAGAATLASLIVPGAAAINGQLGLSNDLLLGRKLITTNISVPTFLSAGGGTVFGVTYSLPFGTLASGSSDLAGSINFSINCSGTSGNQPYVVINLGTLTFGVALTGVTVPRILTNNNGSLLGSAQNANNSGFDIYVYIPGNCLVSGTFNVRMDYLVLK